MERALFRRLLFSMASMTRPFSESEEKIGVLIVEKF